MKRQGFTLSREVTDLRRNKKVVERLVVLVCDATLFDLLFNESTEMLIYRWSYVRPRQHLQRPNLRNRSVSAKTQRKKRKNADTIREDAQNPRASTSLSLIGKKAMCLPTD